MVGNVYLGKVTRVLPGLQAAFIDIGQERAAFLHVEDLIRPSDFDTYMQGTRKQAPDEDAPEVTGNEELDTEADAEIEVAPPVHTALTEGDAAAVAQAETLSGDPEEAAEEAESEETADALAEAEAEDEAIESTAEAVDEDDEDEASEGGDEPAVSGTENGDDLPDDSWDDPSIPPPAPRPSGAAAMLPSLR